MVERTRHHGGHGRLGQAGTHAEAVEGTQRGQGGRGHQGAVGDVPQIAAQGLGGQDRAGVDLDIEGRAALGQGQPARHRRAVFRVLDGKGGPQLPVALGAGQQAAEQRVPLLRLVTGEANTAALVVHRLLEQLGEAGEDVGELGEAFLQLDAQLAQMLRHQAALEAMARPLAALHVLAGAEIGQLFAGAEHELLLGAQLTRLLGHLLDQAAEVAGQRMLGQQLGQVLLHLAKPVGGAAQAGEVGEVADGLVRQVMALVEHVDGLARVRQHGAAAQGQVGQDHVVVGDDHVDLGHALARLVEGALLEIRAVAVGALAVVGGQGAPDLVFQLLGPAVAVAVPAVAGELLDHLAVELLAVLVDVDAEAFFLEHLRGGALCLAFLQQHVQLGQAQVAATALGQGEAELQPGIAHQVRQVLVDDLLLQRHGRGGNHQALAGGLGGGDGGQAVGHRLAGTGARLHGHHGGLAVTLAFVVGLDRAEHLGHFGNHQALAIAGLEPLGFEETAVGALDLGLEFGTEHGRAKAG